MRTLVVAVLFVLIASPAVADEPALLSPRMQRLAKEPAAGDAFWAERKAAGQPLIEAIDGNPRDVLVTFLWKGDAATKSVHVITLDQVQFDNAAYLARGRMARIEGTEVWSRTYRMRCDLRFSYRFALNDTRDLLHADPLNAVHYESRSGDASVAELPCAPPQPESVAHDGVPRGEIANETFAGASGESHALWIYTPAKELRGDQPLNLVVLISGAYSFSNPFPAHTILDNLIAGKRIAPTMAVSIGFKDMTEYVNASRSNERFAAYVAKELLPWLRSRYPITRDPKRVVIAGSSAPGAGAVFVAMRYPESFGNVLTQAGGYSYPFPAPPGELTPGDHPEAEPLARELATRARLPFRVFLAAGVLDDVIWEGKDPRYAMSTVLVGARHLRDVFEAKGYCLHYREYGGGHEALAWRGTFAEGLTWLFGDSPDGC